jgi:hypothetical protein
VIPHLIELKDPGISVRSQHEVLSSSPGFANIATRTPVFGEEARQLARLHPRQNFTQFWAQLSLDPLALKNPHFRHAADLAHTHLDHLTKGLDFEHGAIIAAPSNYSRNQLGVLLGVVKQSSFAAVGLVDLALLQAAGSDAEECIIIDLQLHQAVLTSFRRIDGQLVKDRVVQVPASGLLALQDAWTGMIADEFIRQSRFDPQHNAETEQFVYNQLPEWLGASQKQHELLLEINHKGTVHQAQVTREHFDQRARLIFTRIAHELDNVRTPQSALHTAAANMSLPGLSQYLPGLIALDEDSTMAACVRHLDHIRRQPDNLNFVTRLPLDNVTRAAAVTSLQSRLPTHVLFRHKAIPLPLGRLLFGTAPTGVDCARIVPVPEFRGGALALTRTPRAVQLELYLDGVQYNGQPATSGQPLMLGDQLQLADGPLLQLIAVE